MAVIMVDRNTWRSIISICLILPCLFTSGGAYKAETCEGGHLSLSCPEDSYLDITKAMYGRQDNNITCPHLTAMAHSNCTSNTSLLVPQTLCNGMTSCEIDAISYHFGDPCNGTYKYLQMEYSCKPCVNTYGDDARCEWWALQGGCTGQGHDQTWMKENCAKACYKCSSHVEPVCQNVLNDVNCTQYAAAGECANNPSWMGAFCKKACGHCERPAPCSNKVNDTMCDDWYGSSECTTNPRWMIPNCAKSCFQCDTDTIRCENKNSLCDLWAMQGYCKSNPGYMIPLCTKACLGCTSAPACLDEYTSCETWADNGECVANPVWMFKNCYKSCLQCDSAPVCANVQDNAWCEHWAAIGECTANYEFMIANCRLSCTRCEALNGPVPKCLNAYLNDTECERWASEGECARQPQYMMTNCYKACTNCYMPYRRGSPAIPGTTLSATSSYSVILPHSFTNSSVITQFTAYFASVDPVHLQIWRPNGTDVFNLVFDHLVVPKEAHKTQIITMKYCVVASAGDYIGFTSLNGPSSIGYTVPGRDAGYIPMAIREVTSSGNFTIINVPVVFSLSAEFFFGTSC